MRIWELRNNFAWVFYSLGFDAYVADAADEIIGCGFFFLHGHDVNGIVLVVGAQNQIISSGLDIFYGASSILENGIHIELALAIGFE